MQQHQIDYYYLPGTDAHANEYLPLAWRRTHWLSQFSGSAGDLLIGLEQAGLWTDPRYFLQADQQLDSRCFSLMKVTQGSISGNILQWLINNAHGFRVGVDPQLIAIATQQHWQTLLSQAQIELVAIDGNLVDQINQDDVGIDCHDIEIHAESYAGESVSSKLARLRQVMHEQQCECHIVTMLDAICWLFNIRGRDIEYNPLVISYAIVTQQACEIYLHEQVLTEAQVSYFGDNAIDVKSYDKFAAAMARIDSRVLIDAASASWWVVSCLSQAEVVLGESPITLMKACKNPVEISGAKQAHIEDAVALIRFWMWFEQNWQGQTEISVAEHLDAFRARSVNYRGASFASIVGFAEHGAIIHYKAEPISDSEITDQSLLLIDSGGQYRSGTTDITRVFHCGEPTADQKQHYTLVLQGHLALGSTVFPKGTAGVHLNAIAHAPLWQQCCDYGHGTGHGVGSYLCVHEGPQRISAAAADTPLQPGMILSNEPGIYLEGKYGIRIENLCVVEEVCDADNSLTHHGPFYAFQDLTLVPYDVRLIDQSLLSSTEKEILNRYHEKVFTTLAPLLSEEEAIWLKQKTLSLSC